MRHADIRTTMNVYGDVVTDEMTQAAQSGTGWRFLCVRITNGSL